ncbi:hypothetical protein RQP46_004270 [Phenoliferia psychrophenolica]
MQIFPWSYFLPTFALLTLATAVPLSSAGDGRALSTRKVKLCYPDTAGRKFQISLASSGSDADPGLLVNLHNCINAQCTRAYLDPVSGTSVPPLSISSGTTPGGGSFCLTNPSKGSQVGGALCVPGRSNQAYVIQCRSCYAPFADLGIDCQIKAKSFGQCWASQGSAKPIVLKTCSQKDPAQNFNVIAYINKSP